MIAPGIRVARGPNWIWNDQGKEWQTPINYDAVKENRNKCKKMSLLFTLLQMMAKGT